MNLKDKAKNSTALSPYMQGRENIKVDEIIGKELTIKAIDNIYLNNTITGERELVPIIIFEELPDNFIFGGSVWQNIISEWLEDMTIEEVNENLIQEKIKVKMEKGRTKKGNNITKVNIL